MHWSSSRKFHQNNVFISISRISQVFIILYINNYFKKMWNAFKTNLPSVHWPILGIIRKHSSLPAIKFRNWLPNCNAFWRSQYKIHLIISIISSRSNILAKAFKSAVFHHSRIVLWDKLRPVIRNNSSPIPRDSTLMMDNRRKPRCSAHFMPTRMMVRINSKSSNSFLPFISMTKSNKNHHLIRFIWIPKLRVINLWWWIAQWCFYYYCFVLP